MKKATKIICFILSFLIVSSVVHFFVDSWVPRWRLGRIFEKFEIIEMVYLSKAHFYFVAHDDKFYDYCVRHSSSCTTIRNFKNYIANSELEPFCKGTDFFLDKKQELLSFELHDGPFGDAGLFNYSVYMDKKSGKSIVIEVSKSPNTNGSRNLTDFIYCFLFIVAVVFLTLVLEKFWKFCRFSLHYVNKKQDILNNTKNS